MDPKIPEMARRLASAAAGLDRARLADLDALASAVVAALAEGRTVYVCGNGGSAADAQHVAAELIGRFRRPHRRALPCVALTTDSSILTAVGNDFSFEEVFSRQVEALGRGGDVLWALSTSGASGNVLAAAGAARARGMTVVAMTGPDGGPLADAADAAFRAPGATSDVVQQMHQFAYHVVCEIVDAHFATDG